jgi:hypothetical protein
MRERDLFIAEFARMRDNESRRQLKEVIEWLGASKRTTIDHAEFSRRRKLVLGTGRWLLEHDKVINWINPQVVPPSSVLWINGIMGAGKSAKLSVCSIFLMSDRQDDSSFSNSRSMQ